MKWIASAAMALAMLGCSGPAGASSPSASVFGVAGTLTIDEKWVSGEEGGRCSGLAAFDDVVAGAQVKVTDAAGTIVGLGALAAGVARDTQPASRGTETCEFTFNVEGIPDEGEIFGVEVARRGVVQFRRDEASDVRLTLD